MLIMRPWAKPGAPVFLVWEKDGNRDEEDAREVQASDARAAAEDYAGASDPDGDYTVIGGSDMTACVRLKTDAGDAPVERFVVRGESVPQYHATKVQ